jgi:CRISPR-associated protein Cas5t
MPHSTAYGLVLNLAGVETRGSLEQPVTDKRSGLPALDVSVGDFALEGRAPPSPAVATLYQQLHGYPVGNSSAALQERARGAKFHIAPARRELLVGLDVVLGVRGDDTHEALLARVAKGLRGELDEARYGLPFAGDNNLLFDRIDVLPGPTTACWYTPVRPGDEAREGTVRLTSVIDRADSSRTVAGLFAPLAAATAEVPAEAWVRAG